MNALMLDPTGLYLVLFVSGVVAVLLLVAGLSLPAESRAGLVAGGLPLALLPPVAAAAFVSQDINRTIVGMSLVGYSPGPVRAACEAQWALQRVGFGVFAAACLLGLALGLLRFFGGTANAPCSPRRAATLCLLPFLGLLVSASLVLTVARAQRVNAALRTDVSDPAARSRSEARLEAEGFPTARPGSLGVTSRFVGRALLIGTIGGATAAIVLLGLAVPGYVLAWRVRFGGGFLALASVAWLLAAAFGTLAALGALQPFRFVCDVS